MQEVLVDVLERARGSLERMVSQLKTGLILKILVGAATGECRTDVEDD